ncbi:MAG: hypothetical protein JRF40_02625 [Deltaproteobacteria bacterium]|nr:hypothetical protein [Deltaproteobacteria bacterium]MBW2218378.1 hypothetical protein [Deltaproteobacteria bacterium]
MLSLNELKSDRKLINEIDWEMTHEDAVRLYLEWGNNWASGNYVVRSKNDVSYYFVVNTWKKNPKIYLMKRNSEDAEELAAFEMPQDLERSFLGSIGHNKGVYSIEGEVKNWLMKECGEC